MARTVFILGIWSLAASLAILGYQVLTYFFYQHWPPVSLVTGWQQMLGIWRLIWDRPLGPIADDAPDWLHRVPLVPAGVILSYLLFLLSDVLRGRFGRRPA